MCWIIRVLDLTPGDFIQFLCLYNKILFISRPYQLYFANQHPQRLSWSLQMLVCFCLFVYPESKLSNSVSSKPYILYIFIYLFACLFIGDFYPCTFHPQKFQSSQTVSLKHRVLFHSLVFSKKLVNMNKPWWIEMMIFALCGKDFKCDWVKVLKSEYEAHDLTILHSVFDSHPRPPLRPETNGKQFYLFHIHVDL